MVESVVGRVVVMVVVGVVGGVAAILLVRAEAAAREAAAANTTSTTTTSSSLLEGKGDRREVPMASHGTRHANTNTDEQEAVLKGEWSRVNVNDLQLTANEINRLQREGSLLDALLNVISRRVSAAQQEEEANGSSKREIQEQHTINWRNGRDVSDHKQKAMSDSNNRWSEGEAQEYRHNTKTSRSKREAVHEYKQDTVNQSSEQRDDDEYQQQQKRRLQQQPQQHRPKRKRETAEIESESPSSARRRIRHRSRKVHHRHYDLFESSETTTESVAAIQQEKEGATRADKASEETLKNGDMQILPSTFASFGDDDDDGDDTASFIGNDSFSTVSSTIQHPTEGRTVVVWKTNLTTSVLLAIPLAVVLTVLAVVCVSCCCCCCCWRRRRTNTPSDETHTEEPTKLTLDWWIPFGCEACCLPDISYQMHREANPAHHNKPMNVHSSIISNTMRPNLSTALVKSTAAVLPHIRPPLLIHDLLSNLPPGASRIGFEDGRIGFKDSRRCGFGDERMLLEKGDEEWCLGTATGVYADDDDEDDEEGIGQVVVVGYGMNRRARSLESLVL